MEGFTFNLARYLRLREALTPEALAYRTGIAADVLRVIEQSRFDGCDAAILQCLAAYYGITTEALIKNDIKAAMETFVIPPARYAKGPLHKKGHRNTTGELGEEWVYKEELLKLRGTGFELAVNPNYALDEQSQFDILSFDADGTMIAIEVKSTEKGPETPFNLSVAEHAMAKQCPQNGQRYEIHRVYHATDPARRGRFIITTEELFRDYELIPKQYIVQKKSL